MESYKINFVNKTLVITASFEKAMNSPDSEEYRLYVQLQQDIPGLKISRRTHKSPVKYQTKDGKVFRCNQFKHLTYENMERFINSVPKSDELMKVYRYIRYGAGLAQTSSYTAVRRWFTAQFPDLYQNPIQYLNGKFEVLTDIVPIIKTVQEESKELNNAP